jgi:hypothetical protein
LAGLDDESWTVDAWLCAAWQLTWAGLKVPFDVAKSDQLQKALDLSKDIPLVNHYFPE